MHTRIPLPRPVQPLHVYRHLLRAASYFPRTMRPFLDDRIQSGFRQERERAAKGERSIAASPRPLEARQEEEYRRKKALADARARLPSLQAATAGDQKSMRRTMWHVFGRSGKKRRELMASFVAKDPDPPLDSQELEKRMRQWETKREKNEERAQIHPWKRPYERDDPTPWLRQHLSPIEANWDLPKLQNYIKAQKDHQQILPGASFPRSPIVRNPNPLNKAPKVDIWGRPVAPRRVTKYVRKWWKRTAEKILPPVDQDDWKFLHSLASGDAPADMYRTRRRRTIAGPLDRNHEAQEGWQWASHASVAARNAERPRARDLTLLTGQTDEGPYSRTVDKTRNGRPFRRRELRREYLKMWEASSYMEPGHAANGEQKERPATAVWGKVGLALPEASPAQRRIFEGVGPKGQKLGK
ncbi:hypothetical protein EsH8_VIII_000081 [Colletotrichum jinshuiense]